MRLVLLDTDVLIEILCERDETIVARWRQLAGGDDLVFYPPANIAELWHGILETGKSVCTLPAFRG